MKTAEIPREWLVECLASSDIVEATRCELRYMRLGDEEAEALLTNISPSFRTKWREFIGLMLADDQLWYFRSPLSTWNDFSGRSGFAIVRGGNPISSLISCKS